MEFEEGLTPFGLSKSEQTVYLTLLRLGKAAPSEISQKAKIHRISVYDILLTLEKKGLVFYAIEKKRKYYQPAPPKRILDLFDERRKLIEQIVPTLESQQGLLKKPQTAMVLNGFQALKTMYMCAAKSKTPLLAITSGSGLRVRYPQFYKIWNQRIKENQTTIRLLMSKRYTGDEFPAFYNRRYLSEDYTLPISTIIFEDCVLFSIWGVEPVGITIQSQETADSFRKYFETLWKTAKP